ncbi:hypothetical protein DAPPUDRAFT_114568, partial [Daphnia pulex]
QIVFCIEELQHRRTVRRNGGGARWRVFLAWSVFDEGRHGLWDPVDCVGVDSVFNGGAIGFSRACCCYLYRNCGRKLTGRWIRPLVKILDTTAVASDVPKGRVAGRSAWWRLGCGGLALQKIIGL